MPDKPIVHVADGVLEGRLQTVDANGNGMVSLGTALSSAVDSVSLDGAKASYYVAVSFNPGAAALNDIYVLSGSATKTIRVRKVVIAITAGAAAVGDVIFWGRSGGSAYTGGATTTAAGFNADQADAGSTVAVSAAYTTPSTAQPSIITAFGARKIAITTGTTPPVVNEIKFGENGMKAPTLRGVGQFFAINLNGITLTATVSCDITVEYTEE